MKKKTLIYFLNQSLQAKNERNTLRKKSDKLLDMNFYGLGGYLNGICEEAGLSYGDIIPVDLFVDGILEAYEEDDLTENPRDSYKEELLQDHLTQY